MVKIIVLVKQVVQSAELKVDRTTKTLVTQGVPQVIRVGLSGQKVSPRLYSACGISGQIQHLARIRNSRIVAAISSDPRRQYSSSVTTDLLRICTRPFRS